MGLFNRKKYMKAIVISDVKHCIYDLDNSEIFIIKQHKSQNTFNGFTRDTKDLIYEVMLKQISDVYEKDDYYCINVMKI